MRARRTAPAEHTRCSPSSPQVSALRSRPHPHVKTLRRVHPKVPTTRRRASPLGDAPRRQTRHRTRECACGSSPSRVPGGRGLSRAPGGRAPSRSAGAGSARPGDGAMSSPRPAPARIGIREHACRVPGRAQRAPGRRAPATGYGRGGPQTVPGVLTLVTALGAVAGPGWVRCPSAGRSEGACLRSQRPVGRYRSHRGRRASDRSGLFADTGAIEVGAPQLVAVGWPTSGCARARVAAVPGTSEVRGARRGCRACLEGVCVARAQRRCHCAPGGGYAKGPPRGGVGLS